MSTFKDSIYSSLITQMPIEVAAGILANSIDKPIKMDTSTNLNKGFSAFTQLNPIKILRNDPRDKDYPDELKTFFNKFKKKISYRPGDKFYDKVHIFSQVDPKQYKAHIIKEFTKAKDTYNTLLSNKNWFQFIGTPSKIIGATLATTQDPDSLASKIAPLVYMTGSLPSLYEEFERTSKAKEILKNMGATIQDMSKINAGFRRPLIAAGIKTLGAGVGLELMRRYLGSLHQSRDKTT